MDKSFNLCIDEISSERFSKFSYAFDKVFKNIRPGNINQINKNTLYRYENKMDSKFSEALDELQIYSPLYRQLSQMSNKARFHTINNSNGERKKIKSFVKSIIY